MNGIDIKRSYQEQLAEQVLRPSHRPPEHQLLPISPALAKAVLQKGIRRGETYLARRAASTLLAIAPDSFWRRSVIIAAEDIGLANTEAVALVTAAARSGKRWRTTIGGDHAVGQFIVGLMSSSDKCRATDDLTVVASHHPGLSQHHLELANATQDELLAIIASSTSPLPLRALAFWYAVGTQRRPYGDLQARRGEPDAVFDWMCEAGYPHSLVEVARDSYRMTGEMVGPFVPFLWRGHGETPVLKVDDDFPPGATCGLCTWAKDMFTPEGRRALAALLRLDCATARWVRRHIPPAEQVSFLGGVLFRVESGLVRKRVQWPLAIELRRMADIECHGPLCPDATEIIARLRADIPLLNEVRAHVR